MPVFDIEADGLNATKIHVISYWDGDKPKSITDYNQMAEWLEAQETLIGHEIVRYDLPTVERILGVKVKAKIIDTLAISWYLDPKRKKHGLEFWGEELGIVKPKVDDWENLDLSVYVHRCETDVRINQRLWMKQKDELEQIYDEPIDNHRILDYLTFKMECAREQERSRWRLDIPHTKAMIERILPLIKEKEDALKAVMPKVVKMRSVNPPAKPFKKNGELSEAGQKWLNLTQELALSFNHSSPIMVEGEREKPNPGSSDQVKAWLFSLGWEPETFKEKKEDDGSIRKIPQVKKLNDPELCDSVLRLIDDHPDVEHLAGLTMLNHRHGLFAGFLRDASEDAYLQAKVQGFTNTLRFKHTEIVNLPGVDKPWGTEVRSCLIAREGHELMGCDMASLESMTKRHYMQPYDPTYVEEMSKPDFDEHLDLAVQHGVITRKQYNDIPNRPNLKKIRKRYKPVNYAGIYGIGKDKLARELKIPVKEAKELIDAYWSRNWSVKEVVKAQKYKTVYGKVWLFNPVSKFYYSLRYEKDIFSTLNQGTGVYCFDTWLAFVRHKRKQLTAQFHDEGVWEIKPKEREIAKKEMYEAIDKTNKKLKLNITLGIGEPSFGRSYADVH